MGLAHVRHEEQQRSRKKERMRQRTRQQAPHSFLCCGASCVDTRSVLSNLKLYPPGAKFRSASWKGPSRARVAGDKKEEGLRRGTRAAQVQDAASRDGEGG